MQALTVLLTSMTVKVVPVSMEGLVLIKNLLVSHATAHQDLKVCNKIKSIQNSHSFNEILILGLRCEKNINDCFGIPCKHGGRCTDGNNNFSCDCDDDWLGNTCEIKNLCKDIDCKNSGECKYDNGNFTCHCNHPYNGPTCNMARK